MLAASATWPTLPASALPSDAIDRRCWQHRPRELLLNVREIITRGDLPHWYMPAAAHFVTYRLADTLPADVLQRLRAERDRQLGRPLMPGVPGWEHKAQAHKRYFGAYDRYLDRSLSVCWLQNSAIAEVIIGNLYHHHGTRYQLLEYTVMPNHIHVLFVPCMIGHVADAASVSIPKLTPSETEFDDYFSDETSDSRSPLTKIMHSLKSYTANEANKLLSRDGRFWQHESYDHWVRDDRELARIAEYIANNAVNAGLTTSPWDWPFCSAHDRRNPRVIKLPEWW